MIRFRQQRKRPRQGRSLSLFCSFHQTAKCPWGRVFRLPLVTTQKRKSTRVKHRSRVVLITREARGHAPRVLTAPFGLDRSPANDGPNESDAGETLEYHNWLPNRQRSGGKSQVADQRLLAVL